MSLSGYNRDDPKTWTTISGKLPKPSIEDAIIALVDALVSDKGWMRAYANAIVRDAIDRVDRPYVPLTDAELNDVVRNEVGFYSGKDEFNILDGDQVRRIARAAAAAVLAKVKP